MERALCPLLVGRNGPLNTIEDALLQAHRGAGQVILLTGEAGVGKTRLSSEVERHAVRGGMAVMRGGCSEGEVAIPYLPFVEAIGNHLMTVDIESVRRRLGPVAAAPLGRLFPRLESDAGRPSESGDPLQSKIRLFESILLVLQDAAGTAGLLLTLEDLHWADASSLELLDYLARRLKHTRILLLGSYRSEEVDRSHRLVALTHGWRRAQIAQRIELLPLSAEEVGAMVGAIFGGRPARADFRDFLHARSEGNPFIVEEMLKAALDRGDILSRGERQQKLVIDLSLPRTVRELVLLRVARMSSSEVEILETAAALGPSFRYPTLVAVCGLDEDVVRGALGTFVRQQLMQEDRAGQYGFRHDLTREVIYDDLIAPERERLHRRAAQALSELPQTTPAELAHHLLAAGQLQDAIPVCLKAAEDAERQLAYQSAVDLYQRVLPAFTHPAMRGPLLCRLGNALFQTGDRVRSQETLEEGIALLEAQGLSRETARYRLVLGRCLWERSRPDRARVEYEQASALLEPDGPSEDLAIAYLRLAGLHDFEFRPRDSLAMAEKAVAVAEAAGAETIRIWAYNYVGLALAGLHQVPAGLEYLDRSYREASERGLAWIAGSALSNGIAVRLEHFLAPQAVPMLAQLHAHHGWPLHDILAYFNEGLIYLALGDAQSSRRSSEEGLRVAVEEEATTFAQWTRCNLAMALAALGEFEEARRLLDEPHQTLDRQATVLRGYAAMRVFLDAGDVPAAAEESRRVAAVMDWSRPQVAQELQALDKVVEALVRAGAAAEAAQLYDHAAATGLDLAHPYVARIQGRLALARGDHEVGRARLTQAATFFEQAGYRDDARRTRELLGLPEPEPAVEQATPTMPPTSPGERLVTVLFADVRGYTAMTEVVPPSEMAERVAAFYRSAKQEIESHAGVVDQYAGDAVMATFNLSPMRLEHCELALEAAVALRDKAAFASLPLGIGIAVGAAIVGELTSGTKLTAIGETVNLAARLMAEAGPNEIVVSADAYRRLAGSIEGSGLVPHEEDLRLKGFSQPARVYRLVARQATALGI
jgi:class 3 adenylate cyclase